MQNLINMQISSIRSSPLSSLCPLAVLSAADLSLAGTAWPDVLMVPLQPPSGRSEPPKAALCPHRRLCAPPLIPAQHDSELQQQLKLKSSFLPRWTDALNVSGDIILLTHQGFSGLFCAVSPAGKG